MTDTYIPPANIYIDHNGTVRSTQFSDIYYAPNNGVAESEFVFIKGCKIPEMAENTDRVQTVLECGFGTGLNFLLTLQAFVQQDKAPFLHFISIEKHPIKISDLQHIYTFLPENLRPYANAVLQSYPPLTHGKHTICVFGAVLTLYFDDVLTAISCITDRIDAVYLDGFAPSKNISMWRGAIFNHLYKICSPTVQISTFTSASPVQKSLKSAGFFVYKRKGFGRKRESLIAQKLLWHLPNLDKVQPICIVGAGIMGTTLAGQLAELGYRVHVYDKHIAPLQGTSGNPYAVLMPKFNRNIAFHQNAFAYACAYYKKLGVLVGNGVFAYDVAIKDIQIYTDTPHATAQDDGIFFPKAGAVHTQKLADIVYAHSHITYIQKTLSEIPNQYQWVVLCMGADTNSILNTPLPYTINRGSIAVVTNPPAHMPTTPTYHKGYTMQHNNMGICGSHFERIGDWTGDLPPINKTTHIKHIGDKMQFFGLNVKNTDHTLRTGIRANTKHRLPVIHQINNKTHTVYGMGSRGYINAPYTAHLICTYLLNHTHHTDMQWMFENIFD